MNSPRPAEGEGEDGCGPSCFLTVSAGLYTKLGQAVWGGYKPDGPEYRLIPYIPYLAGPETGRLWTGHYKPASTESYRIYRTSTACGSLRRTPGRKIFAPACEKLRNYEIASFLQVITIVGA